MTLASAVSRDLSPPPTALLDPQSGPAMRVYRVGVALAPEPLPEVRPTMARCAACRHYVPNPRGWGGLGSCLADAPASRVAGSLWPASEIRCRAFGEPRP